MVVDEIRAAFAQTSPGKNIRGAFWQNGTRAIIFRFGRKGWPKVAPAARNTSFDEARAVLAQKSPRKSFRATFCKNVG